VNDEISLQEKMVACEREEFWNKVEEEVVEVRKG